MRPRRTIFSDVVFRLTGGERDHQDGTPILRSCWVFTDRERQAIARGANVEMIVWGDGDPPAAMRVVDYPLGAPPKGAQ